jgi:hypothetical protein
MSDHRDRPRIQIRTEGVSQRSPMNYERIGSPKPLGIETALHASQNWLSRMRTRIVNGEDHRVAASRQQKPRIVIRMSMHQIGPPAANEASRLNGAAQRFTRRRSSTNHTNSDVGITHTRDVTLPLRSITRKLLQMIPANDVHLGASRAKSDPLRSRVRQKPITREKHPQRQRHRFTRSIARAVPTNGPQAVLTTKRAPPSTHRWQQRVHQERHRTSHCKLRLDI